jgi:hypothetical protein
MNSVFTFRGSPICEACLDQMIMQDESVKAEDISRHLDPTVCINCQGDNGNIPLDMLAGLPTCSACTAYFRNRPFPAWLKVGFALLIVIVILHLAYNRRFWLAYQDLRQANQTEYLYVASALYESASRRVPENAELRAYSAFLVGLRLLQDDRPAEALSCLESCRDGLPPENEVDRLILATKCELACARSDYDEFLRIALQMRRAYRDEGLEWARVASAYACKYAETGDRSYHKNALAYLDSARARSPGDPAVAAYDMRIKHRLYTREILSAEEFFERYPEGWVMGED